MYELYDIGRMGSQCFAGWGAVVVLCFGLQSVVRRIRGPLLVGPYDDGLGFRVRSPRRLVGSGLLRS